MADCEQYRAIDIVKKVEGGEDDQCGAGIEFGGGHGLLLADLFQQIF